MYKFPNVYDKDFNNISNGAKYYEVLTSDNQLDWVTADKMTDDEIEAMRNSFLNGNITLINDISMLFSTLSVKN